MSEWGSDSLEIEKEFDSFFADAKGQKTLDVVQHISKLIIEDKPYEIPSQHLPEPMSAPWAEALSDIFCSGSLRGYPITNFPWPRTKDYVWELVRVFKKATPDKTEYYEMAVCPQMQIDDGTKEQFWFVLRFQIYLDGRVLFVGYGG